MRNNKLQIAIIGSAGIEEYPYRKPDKKIYKMAYELGSLVAKSGSILICGGKGGIMKEACRGAKENGGITVGIISGNKRGESNRFVDVEIVSGFTNYAEDGIIISMSDGIIAIGGGAGTLQEITLGYRNKKPTVLMKNVNGWSSKLKDVYLDERKNIKLYTATRSNEAVRLLFQLLKGGHLYKL